MDTNSIEFWKSIKSHQECALISELYHHIGNFDDNFVGKVKNTLIMSPVASASIGFDIYSDEAIIGVNEKIFDLFINMRWYCINVIKDHPAMFWVADFGNKPKNKPVALRFNMRRSRANSLSEFKNALIVKVNHEGMFEAPNPLNSFRLNVNIKRSLDWEKI